MAAKREKLSFAFCFSIAILLSAIHPDQEWHEREVSGGLFNSGFST
jgi:hypothetical protein